MNESVENATITYRNPLVRSRSFIQEAKRGRERSNALVSRIVNLRSVLLVA